MKFKCLVSFGLFVAVQSASIHSSPIHIPVKVIYGEEEYELPQSKALGDILGRKNLNEKIQVSPEELHEILKAENHVNLNGIRNLAEKVQLSPDDLLQADKQLPLRQGEIGYKTNSVEEGNNSAENVDSEAVKPSEDQILEENKPSEPVKPEESTFGLLGEAAPEKETSTVQAPPSSTTEEKLPDPNFVLLIQIAQNIVSNGLTNIRENIENQSTNQESDKNPTISAEQWNRLNQTISDFFATLLQVGSLKSSNENLVQYIVTGVRSATNNFVENLRQSNTTQTVNPPRPGIGQNIINLIASGFQRISENLNNIATPSTTKNTVLGDKDGATTAPPGPIQNIINQVQQFFSGQPPSNPSQGTQEDSPTTSSPVQVFQNVANQVGQAINSLNPFTQSTAAPGSQADEGSTPANPFQNVAQQVGQAINNLNPFRPTAAPGSQGDDPTTLNPLQSFQNAANQVGQAINSLNPFRPSTAASGSQGDDPTTVNPLQSFQNAANQVGQAINSLNPFRPSTAAAGSQGDDPTTLNPLQSFQNAANQVGQAINSLNPFRPSTAAPGTQNEESSNAPPLQQVFQNVANQVGAAINNLNPFNPSSTPAAGAQNEGTTASGPVQGVQNVINQLGQAVGGLNPLNQASTLPPSNNPLEGAQNAINQAGQAVNNLNPLNQGSSTASSPVGGSLQTIQAIGNQGQQLLSGQTPVNPVQSIQSAVGSVRPPAAAVSEAVETIQSIGSEIISPGKKPEEKSHDASSDEEIMMAID